MTHSAVHKVKPQKTSFWTPMPEILDTLPSAARPSFLCSKVPLCILYPETILAPSAPAGPAGPTAPREPGSPCGPARLSPKIRLSPAGLTTGICPAVPRLSGVSVKSVKADAPPPLSEPASFVERPRIRQLASGRQDPDFPQGLCISAVLPISMCVCLETLPAQSRNSTAGVVSHNIAVIV